MNALRRVKRRLIVSITFQILILSCQTVDLAVADDTDMIVPGQAGFSNDELIGPVRSGRFYIKVGPISGKLEESAQETLQQTIYTFVNREVKNTSFEGMTFQKLENVEVVRVNYDTIFEGDRRFRRRRMSSSVAVVEFSGLGFYFDRWIDDGRLPSTSTLDSAVEDVVTSYAFTTALQISIDSQLRDITDVTFGFLPTSPTDKPTISPTDKPTISPTDKPTILPTDKPTISPTSDPTRYPTSSPTYRATKSPTANPTTDPTPSPTAHPTKYPTANPTKSPTSNPTRHPTHTLTSRPTTSPTRKPTTKPTHSPVVNPTESPTLSPILDNTDNGVIIDPESIFVTEDSEESVDPSDNTTLVNGLNKTMVRQSSLPIPAIALAAIIGLSFAVIFLLLLNRRRQRPKVTFDEDSSWSKSESKGNSSHSVCPFPTFPRALSSGRRTTMDESFDDTRTMSPASDKSDTSFDIDIGNDADGRNCVLHKDMFCSFDPDEFPSSGVMLYGGTLGDPRQNVTTEHKRPVLRPSHFSTSEFDSMSHVSSSGSETFRNLDFEPDEHWDPDDTAPDDDNSQVFNVAMGDSISLMSNPHANMDTRKISPYRLDFINYDDNDSVSEKVLL